MQRMHQHVSPASPSVANSWPLTSWTGQNPAEPHVKWQCDCCWKQGCTHFKLVSWIQFSRRNCKNLWTSSEQQGDDNKLFSQRLIVWQTDVQRCTIFSLTVKANMRIQRKHFKKFYFWDTCPTSTTFHLPWHQNWINFSLNIKVKSTNTSF